MNLRVGFGYDVHPFKENRKLILGGVDIPFQFGLDGHSDADVICHAVADALLGAVALGDIGIHFPDTDEKNKNISSLVILSTTNNILAQNGYCVNNVDVTIVLEKPKISQYYPQMRKNIAKSLLLNENDVSIKATTSEKMGFVGRMEGVAAYAIVSVKKR